MSDQLPKITRIDMLDTRQGVEVRKFRDGWNIHTTNCREEDFSINYEMTLAEMTAWLKEHGWVVREWPGGARAFLPGAVGPVRGRNEILNLRKRLEYQVQANGGTHPRGFQVYTLELAIDL